MAQSDAELAEHYRAALEGSGRIPLPAWNTVVVRGSDGASFLQNTCTNDIRALPEGGQCEAFFTDVKGKIVAHAIVFRRQDEFLLVMAPGQAVRVVGHLERYIIRENVSLADDSAAYPWSLAIGRQSSEAVAQRSLAAAATDTGAFRAACRQLWPGGFWVASPPGDQSSAGAALQCDDAVWHALRIESGWPLFGVDFDGSHLPQEVARDRQAISFRKGCYLGQETIARIDALGHVNKKLATVRFDGEVPKVGAELTAGEQATGAVTSAVWSPRLSCPLGLAMIRRGFNEPGTVLHCGGSRAEVIATPAVSPEEAGPRHP